MGEAAKLVVAPREVEREARRILSLLAKPGARARRAWVRRDTGTECAEVACGRARTIRFDLKFLQVFAANDWVEPDGEGTWRISGAGAAWLRRKNAEEDPLRAQHQVHQMRQMETPERTMRRVRVNGAESPLEWLRGRKDRGGTSFIGEAEFEAGERLRRDFTAALMMPSVTANWQGFHLPRQPRRGRSTPGRVDLSDNAIAARQRVDAALAEVGPEISGLLVDVCCLLIGLEEAEKARQWPKRSAKVVLRVALGLLARHYGIAAPQGSRSARRRHSWAREGSRPTIDG